MQKKKPIIRFCSSSAEKHKSAICGIIIWKQKMFSQLEDFLQIFKIDLLL
jgi:hypothetical protein